MYNIEVRVIAPGLETTCHCSAGVQKGNVSLEAGQNQFQE